MSETNLYIEADGADLVVLKKLLYEKYPDIDLVQNTETQDGRHNEAFLVSLVIALGGPIVIREIMKTVRHWMDTSVKRDKIELVKFGIETGATLKPVTIDEIDLD